MRQGLRGYLIGGAICALFAGLVIVGCSSDSSTDSNGDITNTSGKYLIEGYFGNALVQGGNFFAEAMRIEAKDAGANELTIHVDGTEIPLVNLASTADFATFTKYNFGYEAGKTYTVTAALGDKSATCSFTAPVADYPEITAPADASDFTPGQDMTVTGSNHENGANSAILDYMLWVAAS